MNRWGFPGAILTESVRLSWAVPVEPGLQSAHATVLVYDPASDPDITQERAGADADAAQKMAAATRPPEAIRLTRAF